MTKENTVDVTIESATGLSEDFQAIKSSGSSIGKAWRASLDSQVKSTREAVEALTASFRKVEITKNKGKLVPHRYHDYARTCFNITMNEDERYDSTELYGEWKKVLREVTTASGCDLGFISKPRVSDEDKRAALDKLVLTDPTSAKAKAWIKQKPVLSILDSWGKLQGNSDHLHSKITDNLKDWGKHVVKHDGSLDIDLKKIKSEMEKVITSLELILVTVPNVDGKK